MSGGGSPSNTTSTTTTELPAWAQPYATQLLDRGASLSNQTMPVYSGQRTADLNTMQENGINMTAARAYNGSPDITAGSDQVQKTLNGDYLGYNAGTNAYQGDNPYLQSTIDQAAGDITRNYNSAVNGTDSNFARAGAFGGSAWAQAQNDQQHNLASALQNSSDSLRMQNYNQSAGLAENALNRNQSAYLQERSNQLGALSPALQYGNQAYTDAQQLQGVGSTLFGYDQQKLADAQNLFNEQAQSPYKQLDVLANTIHGAVGGGGTVSQSAPGTNPYGQAVGSAAALYSLFGK